MSRLLIPPVVIVDPKAAERITTTAMATHPRETGGILLGYRKNEIVVVCDAVEVVDPGATSVSYTSRELDVQGVLDRLLIITPPGIGYVGPWHAHPAPARHSRPDKRALKRIARQYAHPIASLVGKRTMDTYLFEAWVGHGRKVSPGQLRMESVQPFPSTAMERRRDERQDQSA